MEYEKPESLSVGRTKKVGKVIKKIGDTSNTEEENRCGIRQTGAFLTGAAPNGLFGLGIENISAQSMLASKGLAANSFSMCFGPDGIGRIVFGDKGSPGQGETPLNLDQPYPTYNISLTGITVGSKITDFDFRAIFDSSTSFTYLNDPVYKVITENFDSEAKRPRIQPYGEIPFEYCYGIKKKEEVD
uniref:Aspartic proteinase nepenthesin-1 n=1 Tax=Solanum tuberosum TaxID=4113 RepID=M0ZYI9_SOLTU